MAPEIDQLPTKKKHLLIFSHMRQNRKITSYKAQHDSHCSLSCRLLGCVCARLCHPRKNKQHRTRLTYRFLPQNTCGLQGSVMYRLTGFFLVWVNASCLLDAISFLLHFLVRKITCPTTLVAFLLLKVGSSC